MKSTLFLLISGIIFILISIFLDDVESEKNKYVLGRTIIPSSVNKIIKNEQKCREILIGRFVYQECNRNNKTLFIKNG